MYRKMIKRYRDIPIQARASFWFLICAFLQKGISFLTTPIFTRLLSTAEYGQYNIFNSWLGILSVCISLNLYCGVYSRGLVTFDSDREVFISSLQGLSMTLVLVWSAVYFVFHAIWNQLFALTTAQMGFMFLIIWGTSVFGFWSMEQRVDFSYQKLVVVTLVMSLIKPLLGIILVQLAVDKVTARIFGLALVDVVFGIILFWAQLRKGKIFYSSKYWKHALAFNVPLIPHYLSNTVLNSADRIMIGKMVSESAAGIYSLAYSVSLVMGLFSTALIQTLEPWLYKKINEKDIESISKIAYPTLMFIAAVNVLLIALAPEAIAVFAPREYYDAIWIMPPVAMSAFFTFSYFLFAEFEFFYEKTKLIATATCVGAVLNIILNYVFIKAFGYYAAGYTTLFCYVVYASFHFYFMRKICKENLDNRQPYGVRKYFSMAAAFLVVGFLLLLTYPHPYVRYGVLGCALLLCFLFRKQIMDTIMKLLNIKNHKEKGNEDYE